MGNVKTEDTRISVRISPEFKLRIKKATEVTGIDEPTLVKHGVEALVGYIERHGGVSFPVEIIHAPSKKPRKTG